MMGVLGCWDSLYTYTYILHATYVHTTEYILCFPLSLVICFLPWQVLGVSTRFGLARLHYFVLYTLPFPFLYSLLFTHPLPLFQTPVVTSLDTGGKRNSPLRSKLESSYGQELLEVSWLRLTLCTSPFCQTAI